MSNRKLINGLWHLLPKSWSDKWTDKKFKKQSIDNKLNKELLLNLPLHEQLKNRMIYSFVSTIEPHFEIIHDLLIWRYPEQSVAALFGINVIYWFIVFLSSHLITAIAFGILMYKIQEFWSTVVWPEIALEPPTPPSEQENWTCVDPNLLSAPEIIKFVDSCLNWIKDRLINHWKLRSTNHLSFFLINLLVFTSLGYIGTLFSGAKIIYFILMITLLSPGINAHLFPFIKSSSTTNKQETTTDNVLNEEEVKSDLLNKENQETTNKMDDKELNKSNKLIDQLLDNTKSYFSQLIENDDQTELSTEEYIKQKENQLNKAHDFLTSTVLNQDPSFPIDTNEINNSFKYIEIEFKKLDKLKESINYDQKSSNSIESNLVTSHFDNDSQSGQSSDDDFEIIN